MYKDNAKFSSAWNFGPGMKDNYTVREIIEKLIQYLGKGSYKINQADKDDAFHETQLLLLDTSKAKQFLNWEPAITIDEAINYLCDWYKEDKIDYDSMIHETVHLVRRIFDKKGIPFNSNNDEMIAYYQNYWIKKFWDKMSKFIKEGD